MICMRCGASVVEGRKFCGDCGAPLPRKCKSCGSENPPDKRFCGDCGAALTDGVDAPPETAAAVPTARSVERRPLTVMFVDLVGSTALGARLDPEDLRDVIAAFRGSVTGVVARFDGFVARYMGDGVLIYFGYPHAHEDDPERAIRAGLAIVEGVRHLNTIAGPPATLSSRVGIASGLVVVGDLIGFGSSLESAAIGDTPNLAARLQTAAEINTVVVSETTRRLAGDLFEYRELNLGVLKGRTAPERAWAVLGEGVTDSRFEALRRHQLPLVNRIEEMELLLRRWQQAKSGEGRVVLIWGESGIGKSRLVAALEQRVVSANVVRLRFLCSPHHRDTPLYPVIRQIERGAIFQRVDPPAVRREKLARSMTGDVSQTDLKLFADLLSLSDLAGEPLEAMAPQRRKEMTFSAILRQFENLAGLSPILAILEDMHWADPTTLDLLALLIERAERLPMLLIVTTRPGSFPAWSSRPNVTVQQLNGFDRRVSATLVKEVIYNQTLPAEVIDRIIAHADGVPLFIEELTKTVLERGFGRDRHPEVSGELLPDAIPTSLQASLMARLDRLPFGKEAAQIASVVGRDFSFEMLQALAVNHVERALGELVQAGLVIERGQPPEATYTFKHALVQDAAYASLLRDRRRSVHQRVAELLEEGSDVESAPPQVIAWHFAEAGLAEKAADNYLQAAEHTKGRFALAETVSHLRNGLRQLQNLPESADKSRRELVLLVALGRALIDHLGSGSEEVRATFERARDLCFELSDVNELIRVHDGLLNFHFTHSEPKEITRYAAELVDYGRRARMPQVSHMARRSAGFAYLLSGRLLEARDEMQLFLAEYDVARDGPGSALTTRDPKVSVCTMLGMCLTALGFPDSGAVVSLEGVQHAETLNHVVSLILGLRRACVQRIMNRDAQGVLDLSRRLLAVTTEYETFKGSRDGTILQCWARLQSVPDRTLLEDMQECIKHFDATKHWALLPFFMASTAELRGNLGDAAGAARLLDRAAELVSITGEEWCEAEIMRLQARFGALNKDDALARLSASLRKASSQSAKLWELRTAIDLAEIWREQGRPAAAKEVLAPIYSWFDEGFNRPDLLTAQALLRELG